MNKNSIVRALAPSVVWLFGALLAAGVLLLFWGAWRWAGLCWLLSALILSPIWVTDAVWFAKRQLLPTYFDELGGVGLVLVYVGLLALVAAAVSGFVPDIAIGAISATIAIGFLLWGLSWWFARH